MKVTIEVTKRTAWKINKAWRWIVRSTPGAMEMIGMAMVLLGLLAVLGEAGNSDCGEVIRMSVLTGGIVSFTAGAGIVWAAKEIDEALAEDIRRKQKRMERRRR